LKLGDGEVQTDDKERIELPSCCISTGNLIDEVFGQQIQSLDAQSFYDKVILCPKNIDSLWINNEILDRLSGEVRIYESVDEALCENEEEIVNYPTEFLNSLTPSGMPPNKLLLKKGAIVMLLRNLDVKQGLCNGTRLVIRRMQDHVLDCEIAVGEERGKRVFIPRVDLIPTDTLLPFRLQRRQFPIRLSFAMTINKSQGQTFQKVGLFLPIPVFTHGQLYVAFSRVKSMDDIKVKLQDTHNGNQTLSKTKNIVYKEIL
jgi:hypothetical protein